MLGEGFESSGFLAKQIDVQVKGISLQAIETLFTLLDEEKASKASEGLYCSYSIELSYIEVYNEKVRDLLRDDQRHNLVILEEPSIGSVMPGLK